MLIARQPVAKHIPAEANAWNNRTLLLGNGVVNRLCFPWGPCKVDIREYRVQKLAVVVDELRQESENEASLRQSYVVSCCN
jgi:hypothetical protein